MTIQLRGGHSTQDPRLDRLPPSDWRHVEKYPLRAAPQTVVPGSPGALGIYWYSNFDNPQRLKIGRRTIYVVGQGDLGSIRGGHEICLLPYKAYDAPGWWDYYNQGTEGRCVEFAVHRLLSLLNRKRYDIISRWLYWEAQKTDEWAGGSYPGAAPFYEGTSGRAALQVIMDFGARRQRGARVSDPDLDEGISAFRWATTWQDVRNTLGYPDGYDGVDFANSWGRSYPRRVRMTDEAGERVLEREYGDCAFVTDR